MIGNGRKPVSVARKNRKLIWKEIRELKTFTSKDIEQRTKVLHLPAMTDNTELFVLMPISWILTRALILPAKSFQSA